MIMPFKNITLRCADITSDGLTDDSRVSTAGTKKYPQGTDAYMVKNDAKYSPVSIDADLGFKLATSATDVVVGVLNESFPIAGQAHSIMVEGVIHCVASKAIKAGAALTASAALATGNTRRSTVAPAAAGNCIFGIALNEAKTAGDFVNVLIGTVGGTM